MESDGDAACWTDETELDCALLTEEESESMNESESTCDSQASLTDATDSNEPRRPRSRAREQAERITERLSVPYMTRFERARVLSSRAAQISRGSPARVNVQNEHDPIEIATLELNAVATPFIVRRRMPDDRTEVSRVRDLKL